MIFLRAGNISVNLKVMQIYRIPFAQNRDAPVGGRVLKIVKINEMVLRCIWY